VNLAFRISSGEVDAAPLPGSLRVNRRLSQWLRFRREGWVEVTSGKVEIGQGILTALAQIVAEELDIPLDRVRMVSATTGTSPDEAVTSGSLSVQESGTALRHACAEAREIFRQAAGTSGKTYWDLADAVDLDREATGKVAPKPFASHRVVGHEAQRLDLPAKIFGEACFIHDLELPGMLHARMVRPGCAGAALESLDAAAASHLPEVVKIVRDGSFVAVIARTESQAQAAAAKLAGAAKWRRTWELPGENAMAAWLKAQDADTRVVDTKAAPESAAVARTMKASFSRPYIAHASLAPSCAIAQLEGPTLRVWTHSQGIYNLRRDLARAFDMAEDRIVVSHVQGAGCYGHNGADDVALDAALLARAAAGRPVRVQWMRDDEFMWEPYGAAMVMRARAALKEGRIVDWNYDVWSNSHNMRPGDPDGVNLLASWYLEKPKQPGPPRAAAQPAGAGDRNAIPLYDLPRSRITSHLIKEMPLRVSALRTLGAYANVFAIESFMDELAAAAQADPIEFRLAHLKDPRAKAVIEAVAKAADWKPGQKGSGTSGRGIGFARYKTLATYVAVIVDLELDRESGRIKVPRAFAAADSGQIINPDGLTNQIEGGIVQSTSWTLHEEVRFDRTGILSQNWDSYPILTMQEAPTVTTVLIDRPSDPPLGAGEASQGPTGAAIANAFAVATGKRIRELPLHPERVKAALA